MPNRLAIPTDTTVVARARRSVWPSPEVRSHALVALASDRVFLIPATAAVLPATLTALENDGDAAALLEVLAPPIQLSAVRRMKLDLIANSLTLEYGDRSGGGRDVVAFADREAADACFMQIWRRLGEGFELHAHRRPSRASAGVLAAALVGVLAATLVLAAVASGFADFAALRAAGPASEAGVGGVEPLPDYPQSVWESALGAIDLKAVCGVGGVLAAIAQVWLYRRLTSPPVGLELDRTG